MSRRVISFSNGVPAILIITMMLVALAPSAYAGKGFNGLWVFTITIPQSPTDTTKRTFTVNFDVSPRKDSLHGQMTITDAEGKTVSGAWRQVGKKISVTYELPCSSEESGSCATLVLLGKMKSGNSSIKKGTVIVMWDTANESNPALYDTSNGTFTGERLQ
jgi:hypothetical protein